jgi:hypothetical protein
MLVKLKDSKNNKIFQVDAITFQSDEPVVYSLRNETKDGVQYIHENYHNLEFLNSSVIPSDWVESIFTETYLQNSYTIHIFTYFKLEKSSDVMGRKMLEASNQEIFKILKKRFPSIDISLISFNAIEQEENFLNIFDNPIFENNPHLYNLSKEDPEGFEDYLRGKRASEGK